MELGSDVKNARERVANVFKPHRRISESGFVKPDPKRSKTLEDCILTFTVLSSAVDLAGSAFKKCGYEVIF